MMSLWTTIQHPSISFLDLNYRIFPSIHLSYPLSWPYLALVIPRNFSYIAQGSLPKQKIIQVKTPVVPRLRNPMLIYDLHVASIMNAVLYMTWPGLSTWHHYLQPSWNPLLPGSINTSLAIPSLFQDPLLFSLKCFSGFCPRLFLHTVSKTTRINTFKYYGMIHFLVLGLSPDILEF